MKHIKEKNIEYWLNDNKLYHRENDKPAYITYYENGNIVTEHWCINGERHRETKPAFIYYCENGNIEIEQWYSNDIQIYPEHHLIDKPKTEEDLLQIINTLSFVKIDNEIIHINEYVKRNKDLYNKYRLLLK